MVLEPLFYVVALLSVFVHGMGKAGFGMGLPILAIPMMSLFISPIQALSILVIPLIFMDLITIHRFKGLWNKEILKFIIPFSLLGIVIGTITFYRTLVSNVNCLFLGPLEVRNPFQGKSFGKILVKKGLEIATQKNETICFVSGKYSYYKELDFLKVSSKNLSINALGDLTYGELFIKELKKIL